MVPVAGEFDEERVELVGELGCPGEQFVAHAEAEELPGGDMERRGKRLLDAVSDEGEPSARTPQGIVQRFTATSAESATRMRAVVRTSRA